MAIFRLEAKIIGRKSRTPGKSVSVVATAAYRAGQSLHDDKADRTFNYRSRTQEVVHSEILVPANVPESLDPKQHKQRDVRQELWNTIERVEKRKDSQLAREFVVALPRELNREQQIELLRGWCKSEFTDKGMVADVSLHKSKNGQNPHAHILCPTRPISEAGFGKKPDTAGKFNGRGAAGVSAKSELDGCRPKLVWSAPVALGGRGGQDFLRKPGSRRGANKGKRAGLTTEYSEHTDLKMGL